MHVDLMKNWRSFQAWSEVWTGCDGRTWKHLEPSKNLTTKNDSLKKQGFN